MRIESALKAQGEAIQQTRDLYAKVRRFSLPAELVELEFQSIVDRLQKVKAPIWTISFVRGYRLALSQEEESHHA